MTYNILVVDDDKQFVASIKATLKQFNIIPAYSIVQAKDKLTAEIDLVLLDLVFDERNPDFLEGMEFLPYLRQSYPDLQVVVMTNYPSKDKIVESVKSGAEDFFLKKELEWTEWEKRLENYCRKSRRIRELEARTKELEKYDESEIIGVSEEIDFVRRKLADIAQHSEDVTLFIYGETGTGKNLAVRYFRKYSTRKDKPFKEFSIMELSTNILESELFGHVKGAFTDAKKDKTGLFESANGGILFLDEIGDYDLSTQIKIMRFMEDRTITPMGSTQSKKLDIHLIMATNKNIPELIKEGKFREDLYQRINRIKIELPPLRKRKKDVNILADYFFHHFRMKERTNLQSISDEVYQILFDYDWPGNIRELQSVIWEACGNARLYNDVILKQKHLRKELFSAVASTNYPISNDIKIQKAKIEIDAIEQALEKTFGQKEAAAQLVGMNADQLRYRVREFFRKNPGFIDDYKFIKKYYGKYLAM